MLSQGGCTEEAAMYTLFDLVPIEPVDARRLTIQLHRISVAAKHAAETLPADCGGREGDPYIKDLIRELHAIFTTAGGRGKLTKHPYSDGHDCYSGTFFKFASAALRTLESHFNKSNSAGGNIIGLALK